MKWVMQKYNQNLIHRRFLKFDNRVEINLEKDYQWLDKRYDSDLRLDVINSSKSTEDEIKDVESFCEKLIVTKDSIDTD